VARRVCVVSGVQKLASLRGALAAGLITDLVLDESLASRVVEQEGRDSESVRRERTVA
jgi:deoxyribonucleoside regulator